MSRQIAFKWIALVVSSSKPRINEFIERGANDLNNLKSTQTDKSSTRNCTNDKSTHACEDGAVSLVLSMAIAGSSGNN
jgi:hypothetical protein